MLPKKYISRRHAEIVYEHGSYILRCLSRVNFVVVGEEEVHELPLTEGTRFELCGISFAFEAADEDEPPNPAAPRGDDPAAREGAQTARFQRLSMSDEDGVFLIQEDAERSASGSASQSGRRPIGAKLGGKLSARHEAPSASASASGSSASAASATRASGRPVKVAPDQGYDATGVLDLTSMGVIESDPFDGSKSHAEAQETGSRKVVMGLVGLAVLLSLLLAVLIRASSDAPPEPLEVSLRPGEARALVFRPPNERTPGLDLPRVLHRDSHLEVEVLRPRGPRPFEAGEPLLLFMVAGLPGSVDFELPFESGPGQPFSVLVNGLSLEEERQRDEQALLAGLDLGALRRGAAERLDAARGIWAQRLDAGHEGQAVAARQALELSQLMVQAATETGPMDVELKELISAIEQELETVRRGILTLRQETEAACEQLSASDPQRLTLLRKLLRIIHDPREPEYVRTAALVKALGG